VDNQYEALKLKQTGIEPATGLLLKIISLSSQVLITASTMHKVHYLHRPGMASRSVVHTLARMTNVRLNRVSRVWLGFSFYQDKDSMNIDVHRVEKVLRINGPGDIFETENIVLFMK
jgi:hypothetical protein